MSKKASTWIISWEIVLLYSLTIAGFPLISVIPIYLGVDSRPISFIYRIFVVIISIIVFAYDGILKKRIYIGWYLFLILYLWLLLIIRLFWDLYFNTDIFLLPPWEYPVITIGIGFIPMLAFFVRPNMATLKVAFLFSYIMSAISLIILMFVAVYLDAQTFLIGRMSTSILNPISFGHLGVSVVILSVVYMHRCKELNTSPIKSVLHYIIPTMIILFGVSTVIVSSSRGPIISLVVVFIVLLLSSYKSIIKNMKLVSYILFIIIFSTSIAYYFERDGIFMPISKIMLIKDLENQSSALRAQIIGDAWIQFLDHPITGSAVVELNTGEYPHNIILECFMATGIVGGILLLYIIIVSFRESWRLIQDNWAYEWIGLLFLQYFISDMLSGSLFGGGSIWHYAVAAIVIGSTFKKVNLHKHAIDAL